METETWAKSYYVKNEAVVGLLETWRNAKTKREKESIEKLLINTLLYLVHKRVSGYKSQDYYKDALQEGILGLFQAFTKFDPKRGPNFFKVATWSISSCIRNFKRHEKISVAGKEIPTENCDLFLADEETLEDQYSRYEEYRNLREAIAKLSDVEQSVIGMRFGMDGEEPRTMQQIGDMLQVSRQRIDQIQRRALINLKKELENQGEQTNVGVDIFRR